MAKTVVFTLILSFSFILTLTNDVYAQSNVGDCLLQLPRNPLTAQGLATPFILKKGNCDQTNPKQQVFVEATVFDPAAKTFSVYHPLVINEGTQPAIKPVLPTLPQNAVVVLLFGTNTNSITLTGNTRTCVNGSSDADIFGQVALCNARAFLSTVDAADEGQVVIPPVGNDKTGRPCPTTRFFGGIDQDPRDIVLTTYLQTNNRRFAQATEANRNALKNFTEISNGSNSTLISAFLDPAPECALLQAPSMMEHGVLLSSMALTELQASKQQGSVPLATLFSQSKPLNPPTRRSGNDGMGGNGGGTEGNCTSVLGVAQNATCNTKWAPLTTSERELVRKVRLASLWELPMAQQAMQRAQSAKVRKISVKIASDHMYLDKAVRAVGQQLGVDLPNQPTAEQKFWIGDIMSQSGHDYDVTYVKWLRVAHGQIFALIGVVRGTTQNSVVRSFSETANKFVLGHMQMLESTGLTKNSSFPTAPATTP
ncbi:hypothetical protein BGX28_005024 [Mortierella sp. GBA30]|nr:hypothetical protein BGX28_005024 [Mortierella sp. GBA30]